MYTDFRLSRPVPSPLSIAPRGVVSLVDVRRVPAPLGCACNGHGAGLGDIASTLQNVGLAGYAALGLGAFLVIRSFTGGSAKARRSELKALDNKFRTDRAGILQKYPRY